jgi:hypothetical protein
MNLINENPKKFVFALNYVWDGQWLKGYEKIKRGSLLASGRNDARYGNGKCSPDFNLFEDSQSIIQKLAKD